MLTKPSKVPPGARVVTVVARARRGRRAVDGAQEARPLRHARGQPGRHLACGCAWPPSTSAPPTSSSARSSRAARACSPPSWSTEFKLCRDQVPAEPFDVVRTVVESDLGGRLEDLFASFDRTPLAAASIAQVHAATLRTGEEVVVKVQRPSVSLFVRKDLRGHGLARAAPRRPHPHRRARQPAGPRRAVRRDDRRGARLPHGGREHDRRRRDAARARPDRVRRPPPAPHARHPPGAGDAAAQRLQLRRRRRHEGRRHRHRGGRAHRDDGAHGGRHGLRRVPRRPARRQPLRAGRRSHRPARLRHRRPPHGRATAGVPADDARRHHQRRARPDGGHARPRCAAARHRPRGGHQGPRPRPARRSTPPRSPARSWSTRCSAS